MSADATEKEAAETTLVVTNQHDDNAQLSNTGITVQDKRFIYIDVNYLAQQMMCQDCTRNQRLLDIVHERRSGLSSVFTVICTHVYIVM